VEVDAAVESPHGGGGVHHYLGWYRKCVLRLSGSMIPFDTKTCFDEVFGMFQHIALDGRRCFRRNSMTKADDGGEVLDNDSVIARVGIVAEFEMR
jgi:hypothetical protein